MMIRAFLCAVGVLVAAGHSPAEAGFIKNACLKADRPASSRALCDCIDKVAKREMTRAQRRKAAKFFSDPHKAQVVRQSDRRRDRALWQNYTAFGQQAAKTCSQARRAPPPRPTNPGR